MENGTSFRINLLDTKIKVRLLQLSSEPIKQQAGHWKCTKNQFPLLFDKGLRQGFPKQPRFTIVQLLLIISSTIENELSPRFISFPNLIQIRYFSITNDSMSSNCHLLLSIDSLNLD